MALFKGTQQSYYEGSNQGNYQFVSFKDIVNQFMIVYVGEDKLITKARRTDVAFHAQRALAELSFDTIKSFKSQEIVLPPSLTMMLPHDYVNYTKVSWSDDAGIKRVLYPIKHTSNPFKIKQDDNNAYDFVSASGDLLLENSDFSDALNTPWSFNSAVDNTNLGLATTANVGTNVDIVNIIGNKLQISTNPFEFSNNTASNIITGRAYAVWQEINVTNIDELSITATGSSAAAESTKSEAGILRVGISTTPGHVDTNLEKNNPSLNDLIVSGASSPNFGPNFLAGTNSTTSNASFPNTNLDNQVLEWNNASGETDITKTLENINVQGYNTLYVLITSYTPFLALDANISTNTVDDISVIFEGTSPDLVRDGDSTTWTSYKGNNDTDNVNTPEIYSYDTDIYDFNIGKRYGIDPAHAQFNGSFYIDDLKGLIHFSSSISGKTVILDYISDSLGTWQEMQVHKFAEEAMYKHIAHAVLSTRTNIPEYIINRYKKEKRAATRQAKLRLSNIKLEEITQVLRGKSKHIKH